MFQKYTIYISSREQKSSAHRKYCSNVEQGKKRQDSRQLLPTHLLRRVNFTYFSHDQKEEEKKWLTSVRNTGKIIAIQLGSHCQNKANNTDDDRKL